MTRDDLRALGRAAHVLRTSAGMTQEELGRNAGYQKGAGVAISRLESGQLKPGPARLEALARNLGLTPDELLHRAAESAESPEDDAMTASGASVTERAKRVQREVASRAETMTAITESFTDAHGRARDNFLVKFADASSRIDGSPVSGSTQTPTGISSVEAFGAALAPPTRSADAVAGLLMRGAIHPIATSALALLGRGFGIGGSASALGGAGTRMLISMVVPAVVLAGSLVALDRRDRRQQREVAATLDQAEAELVTTSAGFEAFQSELARATEILDYVATHAGHALDRWLRQVEWDSGSTRVELSRLSLDQRRRYDDFVEIASAQMQVLNADVSSLLDSDDDADLDARKAIVDAALNRAQQVIESHV